MTPEVGRDPDQLRITFFVRGRVQGVGFRWWARARALERGLNGYARNTADGRVEILAQGDREAIKSLQAVVREEPTSTGRPGRVDGVSSPIEGSLRRDLNGFIER